MSSLAEPLTMSVPVAKTCPAVGALMVTTGGEASRRSTRVLVVSAPLPSRATARNVTSPPAAGRATIAK